MKYFIVALSVFLGLNCQLLAQKKPDPVKVGLGLSANNYLGDYSNPDYPRIYAGGLFSLQKATRRNLNFQLKVGFGKFADQFEGENLPLGDDGLPIERFIESNFIHGELGITYRLFPAKRFQPFLHGGFGWTYFNPKDINGRRLIRNQSPVSEGASTNKYVPQLPFGLGFETRLNAFISIEAAYTYRFMPTDYLDTYGQADALGTFDALQSLSLSFMFTIGEGPELPPKRKAKKETEEGIQIIIED